MGLTALKYLLMGSESDPTTFGKGYNYVNQNLGNIGRSGLGSLIGGAFLGPIGAILGGYLGQGIGRRGAFSTFARSNTLQDFAEAMNRQRLVDQAYAQRDSGSGVGGGTFSFSDSSGYGGTGTSSPSAVSSSGRLGGGV